MGTTFRSCWRRRVAAAADAARRPPPQPRGPPLSRRRRFLLAVLAVMAAPSWLVSHAAGAGCDQPAPPAPGSSPTWCDGAQPFTLFHLDCDGDGQLDWACRQSVLGYDARLSTQSCAPRYPTNSPSACPPAFQPAAATGACPPVPGYTARQDYDAPNVDLAHIQTLMGNGTVFTSMAQLLAATAEACSVIPACKGFNAHGWLKGNVSNALQFPAWLSLCLYAQDDSSGLPPPSPPPSPPPPTPPSPLPSAPSAPPPPGPVAAQPPLEEPGPPSSPLPPSPRPPTQPAPAGTPGSQPPTSPAGQGPLDPAGTRSVINPSQQPEPTSNATSNATSNTTSNATSNDGAGDATSNAGAAGTILPGNASTNSAAVPPQNSSGGGGGSSVPTGAIAGAAAGGAALAATITAIVVLLVARRRRRRQRGDSAAAPAAKAVAGSIAFDGGRPNATAPGGYQQGGGGKGYNTSGGGTPPPHVSVSMVGKGGAGGPGGSALSAGSSTLPTTSTTVTSATASSRTQPSHAMTAVTSSAAGGSMVPPPPLIVSGPGAAASGDHASAPASAASPKGAVAAGERTSSMPCGGCLGLLLWREGSAAGQTAEEQMRHGVAFTAAMAGGAAAVEQQAEGVGAAGFSLSASAGAAAAGGAPAGGLLPALVSGGAVANPAGNELQGSHGSGAAALVMPSGIQHWNFHINPDELALGQLLGRGGFGDVYRAMWRDTPVAVKLVSLELMTKEDAEQYKQEIQVMFKLHHPNIVQLLGAAIMPSGHLAIVMELAPRGSLHALLQRAHAAGGGGGAAAAAAAGAAAAATAAGAAATAAGAEPVLDMRRRLRFAIDTAKGIQYLHGMQPPLVHRDIKPMNLLVTADWGIKVCDFGLSRPKHATFLSTRSPAGTPAWMAPEALLGRRVDEKSDVYSFGMVLYELFTGRLPWSNVENAFQLVHLVGTQGHRPELPAEGVGEGKGEGDSTSGLVLHPQLAHLIRACWAEEPSQRPTIGEALEVLRALRVQEMGEPAGKRGAEAAAGLVAGAKGMPVGEGLVEDGLL